MTSQESGLRRQDMKFLRSLFGEEDCLFSPEETLVFGSDSSRMSSPPLAVVRPSTRKQVESLLEWAHREKIPVYPRSRGTNMVGACVPDPKGIVISSLKMNKILEINEYDYIGRVEPGVVTQDFQKRAAEKKLFYPPDPASSKFSTIGGNVATNAGGMRAVKYGVTRDYILGLEAVLPGGKVIRTGSRCHKNVVGLDLTRLLVGSEGTLAFITEILVKLLPLPESSVSVMTGYTTLEQALESAQSVLKEGILPAALELMAEDVLNALDQVTRPLWPQECSAILLFKLEGSRSAVQKELERILEVTSSTGGVHAEAARNREEEEAMWETRRLINPASFKLRPDKMSEDITVPRSKVGDYIRFVQQVSRQLAIPILTFGHLGDGNIHTNIMYDSKKDRERALANEAKEAVMDRTLKLGGTLSGEHGVGKTKYDYCQRQLGPEQAKLMQGVKSVFDPNNIMNPGKGY